MSTDTAILTPEMHERLQGLLDDLFGDFMGGNGRRGGARSQPGRGADMRGAEIHQQTAVTGIEVRAGKVVGVHTTRGFIATNKVICAVAGFTPRILDMVGIKTPIFVHPLQAMVSEPVKPWLAACRT